MKSIQYWTKICVLNMVTWDLTEMWTENVSKYNIELISVYLTWKTWDLTERRNENVSSNRVYRYLLKNTVYINMVFISNLYT